MQGIPQTLITTDKNEKFVELRVRERPQFDVSSIQRQKVTLRPYEISSRFRTIIPNTFSLF